MVLAVIAGVDGSPEGVAAAAWAGQEAVFRGLPLRLVHAWEPLAGSARSPFDPGTQLIWAENRLNTAREHVAGLHPDLDITADPEQAGAVALLLRAADQAELLVLGSRGLSGVAGFLLGSVGLAVVSRSPKPVVLVRAGTGDKAGNGSGGEGDGSGDVVLGLDPENSGDATIEFAFREAAVRNARLRIVHGWRPQLVYGYAAEPLGDELRAEIEEEEKRSLTEAVSAWRAKFPEVEADELLVSGSPAQVLVDASADASLLVVGRRQGRTVLGARLGHVTHAVLHHAACPVAVVPHD